MRGIRNLIIILILFYPFQSHTEKFEKIYAIMITGKDSFHKMLTKNSAQSFLNQSYPNKYLIIINDGDYSLDMDCDKITEIKLQKKYPLGELRNIGLEQIPENSLWVQWDDDDWHHHELIEKQYEYLKSQNADMCMLKSQVIYAFSKNTAWKSNPSLGICGTIMCRKKNDIFYPKTPKSEDLHFYLNYRKKYRTVAWNNPDYFYLRFIHGHNTWDNNHFKLSKKPKNTWNISNESKNYLLKILPHYEFVK